ncbi:hypothetical protein EYF80_019566 [Liparis tanakae]|uniref:Uncharacterized protein n=1 Tax=Liparis tanakae TaxID=230148 RepID=A0A4Z2HXY7_9TELE|nr:hypothetical protein EYF80_019566 [Liparis tanakae]
MGKVIGHWRGRGRRRDKIGVGLIPGAKRKSWLESEQTWRVSMLSPCQPTTEPGSHYSSKRDAEAEEEENQITGLEQDAQGAEQESRRGHLSSTGCCSGTECVCLAMDWRYELDVITGSSPTALVPGPAPSRFPGTRGSIGPGWV